MQSEDKIIEEIEHYQKKLVKYSARNENGKLLYCIHKLKNMPVEVSHLQKTLVGKTINRLRQVEGKVGEKAQVLLKKWKLMVEEHVVVEDPVPKEKEKQDVPYAPGGSVKKSTPDRHTEKQKIYKDTGPLTTHPNSDKSKSTTRTSHSTTSTESKRSKGSSHSHRSSSKHDLADHKTSSKHDLGDDITPSKHDRTDHKTSSKHDLADHKTSSKHDLADHKTSSKHDLADHKTSSKHDLADHKTSSKHDLVDHKTSSKHDLVDHKTSSKSHKRDKKSSKRKPEMTDFEEALLGLDNRRDKTSPKKKKPRHDVPTPPPVMQAPSSLLPKQVPAQDFARAVPQMAQLVSTYKPLPHINSDTDTSKTLTSLQNNEEALNFMYSAKSNRQRTIYAGKTSTTPTMLTLFDSCIRVLQENIDALEATGGIPFEILRPVIDRATPDQLFNLEDFNPYLLDDTDIIWEGHCKRKFKSKTPEDMESWRDMFIRCTDEKDEKLRAVTERLERKFVSTAPEKRRTQLAIFNTSTIQTKASKKINRLVLASGSGSNGPATAITMAPPRAVRSFQQRTVQAKKKTAPVMAKTLQLYKKLRRR